jgi:L-fuculose-phosphate aldolase
MNSSIRDQIVSVGRRMFERRLTDISGGNISVLDGNHVYITPRGSGSRWHWQLSPGDIVSGSLAEDHLLREPHSSSEVRMHLAIYRAFPYAHAVIHAHPYHVLPFCVSRVPIEPVLDSAKKLGRIDVVPPCPARSEELAIAVVAGLKGKEQAIENQAAGVMVADHGIVVCGRDLLGTLDALERIDWNAWCIMAARLLA